MTKHPKIAVKVYFLYNTHELQQNNDGKTEFLFRTRDC
jgi:hypothetical protein